MFSFAFFRPTILLVASRSLVHPAIACDAIAMLSEEGGGKAARASLLQSNSVSEHGKTSVKKMMGTLFP